MRRLLLLGVMAWFMAGRAVGAAPDLLGTWVLDIEGRNLLVITLQSGADGVVGTVQRPARMTFSSSAGVLMVSGVQMPGYSAAVRAIGEQQGGYVLAQTGHEQDTFLVLPDGEGGARFDFSAAQPGVMSAPLRRARDPVAVADDWSADATYMSRGKPVPSSSEMQAIYDADQADRMGSGQIDWDAVVPRDNARRARVRELLDAGTLGSAQDLYQAAFVFQHGTDTRDYLLAHVLALAAQSRGHAQAGWIATATLDRYLINSGAPSILGTQFRVGADNKVEPAPGDDSLVPDSIRVALGLPTREQAAEQLRRLMTPTE
ncbi:MAG: hypothetical protein ABW278_08130 [Steroidobacteraceae bacterium]